MVTAISARGLFNIYQHGNWMRQTTDILESISTV